MCRVVSSFELVSVRASVAKFEFMGVLYIFKLLLLEIV